MTSENDHPAPTTAPTSDEILAALRGGEAEQESLDSLVQLLYKELRTIAHRHLAKRRPNDERGTLATTALVHEAYIRLVDQTRAGWNDRAHFLALAAVAMRHILIDQAKARMAAKRGGSRQPVTLDDAAVAADDSPEALLSLNDALDRLASIDARLAKVVECRFFGGLSDEETAEALGVTKRTVQRDWVKARMLLRRSLAE
jgi:RNA polymerase sigma factor (TIGR02999 family)